MSQTQAMTFMLEDGGPRHVMARSGRSGWLGHAVVWVAFCGARGTPVFAGTMPLGTYLKHDPARLELCADCAAELLL